MDVVCPDIHVEVLVLEDDLVVQSNITFDGVCLTGIDGELALEVLFGEPPNYSEAFATRAYTSN